MAFHELPPKLKAYLLLHGPLLGVCVWLACLMPEPRHAWITFGLVALGVGFSVWKLELPVFHGRMTLAFVAVTLSLLDQGPQAAMLCAACTALVGTFVRPGATPWKPSLLRPPLYRIGFNAANCLLATLAGCILYQGFQALPLEGDWRVLLGLSSFVGAHFVVNSVGVSFAMALQQDDAWRTIWRSKMLWTLPGFIAGAGVALLIETLFPVLGARALLFLPLAAMVFYWSRLYADRLRLSEKERADKAHIEDLNRLNESVISALAMAIDAKDRYTCTHINRVRLYATALAKAAGLEGPDLQAVGTGAMLHDIGKLGVPDHILNKPGKLDPEEYRRCQEHVAIGAQILSQVEFPFPVVDVVLSHHERWDGRGYPRALEGEAIPIGGRIIAIADVFDALTSNRPYRHALSFEEAQALLQEESGSQFDPQLVELFLGVLPEIRKEMAQEELEREFSGASAEPVTAFARISQASVELTALCDAAEALARQDEAPEVLELLVNRALGLLPVDAAVFYEITDGRLTAVQTAGRNTDRLQGMAIELGEGLAGCVAAEGATRANVAALMDVARRFGPDENIELSLGTAAPLRSAGEVIGVLAVYARGYQPLQAEQVKVLEILAEHGARAMENLRRIREDRELAYRDGLTGAFNARYLLRELDRMTHEKERPLGVILLDLDHFKEVNDTFGHLVGDEILRRVAEVLKSQTRPEDIVCRYAGDEFVVVLPEVGGERLHEVINRIKRAIDALPAVGGRVRVGASAGGACFPLDATDSHGLLHAADSRMYRAKEAARAGRTVEEDCLAKLLGIEG